MVTAKTQYNLKNAREYFEEHLCVGDYYEEGQRVSGEWQGIGAARLGLAGKVRYVATGATGKLSGILKPGLLVEVSGRFVTVSKKMPTAFLSASCAKLRLPPVTDCI